MFWTEKGLGAFNDKKRLRVSSRSDMSECLIATGLPFKGSSKSVAYSLAELNVMMPQVAGIRRFGAAALDLAYVASGRFDGYWEEGVCLWDIAAGYFVKEAGGFVAPLVKGTDPLKSCALIATNAVIHDKLEVLN